MFDLLFGWRKASKCKKLIKRVQCRLKLLKNKRSCIVKQLREDVAELLKNGHQQAAFQRVEQVVMDDNMVHIYDLLYQYCEFVVINLPYIRKHRDCPNDIKEAVSTLIFSSARFGELPELLSIRELFRERYGRKLVSTALQLLPGNLVKRQIAENLDMKTVPDNVKYGFLEDIARYCVQTGPLMLEYKQKLQEDLNDSKKFWKESRLGLLKEGDNSNEFDCSSESSAKLGEEVIYLDDIEEFISPVTKDGDHHDQRLFLFKSSGVALNPKTDDKIDMDAEEHKETASRSSRKSWRKRSRRRRLLQEGLSAAYYGESDETSPEIKRKSRHHGEKGAILMEQSLRNDEKSEVSSIKKCSLARPRHFCTTEVNEAVKVEEVSARAETHTPLPSTLRAITMPCERPSNVTDNINRSNSYPFSKPHDIYSPRCHIHPKLPDYDELAAKFMELKRQNLQTCEALKSC